MKLNSRQIKTCVTLTLITIIAGQSIWVYNMYDTYYYQFFQAKETAVETAILKEHNVRYEQMGGTILSTPLTHHLDTSRYITKTIQSIDTSFQVTYDRLDPYAEMKVRQLLLKDNFPVNVEILSKILSEELAAKGFPNASTYVEYVDVKNDSVIQQSAAQAGVNYVASNLKVIDPFHTIGIKAYAYTPTYVFLKRMTFQLILSIILVSICIVLLLTIIRTFFWREKIELMRQSAVNTMTHEFKRPISSALAQTALIPYYLQKGQTEKVQQYTGNVLLELNKLSTYTEMIQQLSNNNKKHISLKKENIVIKGFFGGIVEKYESIKEKSVAIVLTLTTAQRYIEADRIHFANIIENLIENAIKYSNKRVSIEITVSDAEDKLAIVVKDDGLGISDSDLPHIFEKFYRSESTEVQHVGFGLGLTYVSALMEAHGGEISVTSKVGVGSEFILYFPKSDA